MRAGFLLGIELEDVRLPKMLARQLKVTWNAMVDVKGCASIRIPDGVIVEHGHDTTTYFVSTEETVPAKFRPKVAAILRECRSQRVKVLDVQIDCIPSLNGLGRHGIKGSRQRASAASP